VDVISGQGGFSKLSNEETKNTFNGKYLELLRDGEYVICCVVLDKKSHIKTYGTSAMHPYHYCLNVLLKTKYGYFVGVYKLVLKCYWRKQS